MKHGRAFEYALAAAIASLAVCASARAEERDVNAFIAKTPIMGLPAGNYSQWTDEQKKTAFTKIGGFCQFLCVDTYGNAAFRNKAVADRAKAEAKVCLGTCIIGHLPKDYPQLPALKQQLQADYAMAKQLGSSVPPPQQGK
jgi:hypothetical protein